LDVVEVSQAYKTLGLSSGATREEIRDAYVKRAREVHSDSGTGDDAEMARLNDAYATVQRLVSSSTELVPVSAAAALIRALEPRALVAERERASERVVKQLISHQVTPLKAATRQRATIALVTGGLTVVGAVFKSDAIDNLSSGVADLVLVLTPMLGVITVLLAVLAWKATARASLIRDAVEDAADSMSDRGSYLAILDEVGEPQHLGASWSRAELAAAVETWSGGHRPVAPWIALLRSLLSGPKRITLATVATQIGSDDFAQLLITKGQELELVDERPYSSSEGRVNFRYVVQLPPIDGA
jgi:hypothetical protein